MTVEYIQFCDISGFWNKKDLFSFGTAEYIHLSGSWHKKDLFNCVTAEYIQCVTFQGLAILYNPVYIYRISIHTMSRYRVTISHVSHLEFARLIVSSNWVTEVVQIVEMCHVF